MEVRNVLPKSQFNLGSYCILILVHNPIFYCQSQFTFLAFTNIIFFVLYFMHCMLCIVFNALFYMHWILCIVFNILYSIHCILCIVIHALHSIIICIYYIFFILLYTFELLLKLVVVCHRQTDIVLYRAAIAAKNY